jgi:hypothetical protein
MPVKILINGYFRSGTTAVWAAFKKANPEITTFYEPCHERLPLILDVSETGEDVLHGRSLWEEYNNFNVTAGDIRKVHPNIGSVYPADTESLFRYVRYFDALGDNIGLQTNRWHEFVGDIGLHFKIPVVHVVRNPLDVYASFGESMYKNRSRKEKLKGWIKKHVLFEDYFYVKEVFWFTKDRSALGEKSYRGPLRKIKLSRFSHFEKFFYSWVYYNYYAIQGCKSCGGFFVAYERLNSCALKNYLISHSLDIDLSVFKINKSQFMNDEEVLRLNVVASSLGILPMFEEICREMLE